MIFPDSSMGRATNLGIHMCYFHTKTLNRVIVWRIRHMNKFKNLDKTSILEAIEVKDNKTFGGLLRYLGCDPRNGNENRLLRNFLKDNNIDFFQLKDTITPIISQEQCDTASTFRSLAMLFKIITNIDDYMGSSQYRKLKNSYWKE